MISSLAVRTTSMASNTFVKHSESCRTSSCVTTVSKESRDSKTSRTCPKSILNFLFRSLLLCSIQFSMILRTSSSAAKRISSFEIHFSTSSAFWFKNSSDSATEAKLSSMNFVLLATNSSHRYFSAKRSVEIQFELVICCSRKRPDLVFNPSMSKYSAAIIRALAFVSFISTLPV